MIKIIKILIFNLIIANISHSVENGSVLICDDNPASLQSPPFCCHEEMLLNTFNRNDVRVNAEELKQAYNEIMEITIMPELSQISQPSFNHLSRVTFQEFEDAKKKPHIFYKEYQQLPQHLKVFYAFTKIPIY